MPDESNDCMSTKDWVAAWFSAIYLFALSTAVIYVLIRLLPESTAKPVSLVWHIRVGTGDTRLWITAVAAGAMGGCLHALRSAYWYVGNRKFRVHWTPMYLLQPVCAGTLGLGACLLLRGGFLNPTAGGGNEINIEGFAALSFLMGLFSREAIEKLRVVAESLLTKAPTGNDSAPPAKAAFQLSVDPPQKTPDGNGKLLEFSLKVVSINGYALPVRLKAIDWPKDAVEPHFTATQIVPTASGTECKMTLDTSNLKPGGGYSVLVQAESDGVRQEQRLSVPV